MLQRQAMRAAIPTPSSQENRHFKTLMNQAKNVIYNGEVRLESDISESNKSGQRRTLYRLDGQGKLESKNYRSNYSTYNGRFEGNVRQGHGILTTKDVINDEKVDVQYEGHFEADWPSGQGTLTYVT